MNDDAGLEKEAEVKEKYIREARKSRKKRSGATTFLMSKTVQCMKEKDRKKFMEKVCVVEGIEERNFIDIITDEMLEQAHNSK